jgi:hypothetical protein
MIQLSKRCGATWLLLPLAAFALHSGPVQAAPPISKLEARQLPADIVARRVTAQLADILTPSPRLKGRKPPVLPLTDLWYWTRPRATAMPNLCESDQVTFSFETVGREDGDAETPARATGVTAKPLFHLVKAPSKPDPDPISRDERLRSQAACSGLHPETYEGFFAAPSPEMAVQGAWLVRQVIEEAKRPGPGLQVSCHRGGQSAVADCRAEVAKLDPDTLGAVEDCSEVDAPRSTCLSLDLAGAAMHVVVDEAFAVKRVTYAEFIVFADERID